jgi:invasion protein IalB
MNQPILSALACLAARSLATATAASVAALIASSTAFAQQPPAAPAKPAQAAPKPAPAKPPAKPAQAPAPSAAPQQNTQAPEAQPLPPLIYSQWVKFCPKPEEAGAKQVCFTGVDGRLESGVPVVALVAIDPEGEPKKILRATLPVGMTLPPGTRLIIDQNAPLTAPYVACFNNGCMADYELNADLMAKLKKGQSALIQGISYGGGPVTVPVPLGDFAKVFDGPPTDPKVLEDRQKQLDELQRKAKEAQQSLQGGQQQPGAAPAPAAPAKP